MVEGAAQSPVLVFAAAADWHPGVIGIVAARLKERYERPACVVALSDGIGRGSGRSIVGLPLGPAVIAARQAGLLINGGGHAMAAGFTVSADKLHALREFLIERLGDGLDHERLVPELRVDAALSVGAAQAELIGLGKILLSDSLGGPLAGRIDLSLAVERGRADRISMHTATLGLIEALLVGVAARRPDKTMKSLMSLDSLRARLAGCGRRRPRARQSPSAAD